METYTLLREFADSWVLLALTLIFVFVFLWSFRPGSNRIHQQAANVVFRNDDKPGASPEKEA